MTTPDDFDRPLFARRLHPHRSLSASGWRILLMVFCGCGFFSSVPFVVMGAWPVAGFMGLDVLLLWLAFRANFRAARAYEDISLTPLELRLARVNARGARREWRFQPLYTRLEREEIDDFGVTRLDLVARDRRVEVAQCLGGEAKRQFADEFSRALSEARRGPRFS